MNKEQLIIKAKELGIKDVESFKNNEEIKTAIKAVEQRLELNSKAAKLGIDAPETLSDEELSQLVLVTESTVLASKLDVFATANGVENVHDLSPEEIQSAIEKNVNDQKELTGQDSAKLSAIASVFGLGDVSGLSVDELQSAAGAKLVSFGTPATTQEVKEVPGRSSASFKSKNGNSYQFDKTAPAAFRYAGVLKTQEEWLKDSAALELMISGNLSYLKLKNEK